MRITFIMPTVDLSGGTRVCAIYAKSLIDRGHHVTIIAVPNKKHSLVKSIKNFVKEKKWSKQVLKPVNHFDLLEIPVQWIDEESIKTTNEIPDADVIIATWWETAEWVSIMSETKGKKVHFVQGYEIFDGQPIERVKQVYALSFHKITISNWLAQIMRNVYHASNVFMIPNGIDTTQFHALLRHKQFKPTLGFIFSQTSLKASDTAIQVIKQLKLTLPNLRVVCFGSSQPSVKLALPDFVEFEYSPKQERIREIYSQCDVWLCSSRTEGFGLPVLEAMACRCPVVSTKCGGPEDIVLHGENGFLCDIDDVDSLVNSVLRVLNLTEYEWRSFSDSAFNTANLYSWEDATNLFEKTLLDIFNRKCS